MPASIAAGLAAVARGAAVLRVHDVRETVDALRVWAAVEGRGAAVSDDTLTVSIRGLEAFGRHGVHDAERELGQRFVVDIDIAAGDAVAAASDDLADTVDYAALADAIAAIVARPPFACWSAWPGLIADRVLEEAGARAVTVTVHKPHVALAHTIQETAVTLRRGH